MSQWIGKVPGFCEICDGPINDKFYDAATTMGPWALMCPTCFHHGMGIGKTGIGRGQEYTRDGDSWVKTA
jgi:hypothetical protein